MKQINILIPMADGRMLHSDTIRSIAVQTIQCNVVPWTRPWLLNTHSAQAANMNSLKAYASTPYTVYMDNDVVLCSPTDVEDCVEFLDMHQEWDAVALDTKNINTQLSQASGHVVCAFMAIRHSALERHEFTGDATKCTCIDINKNLKVTYLDSRKLKEV